MGEEVAAGGKTLEKMTGPSLLLPMSVWNSKADSFLKLLKELVSVFVLYSFL